MTETRTYTLEIEVEVKITSHGSPMIPASFSGPGEPPEPREFEIQTITITGDPETVEAMHKKFAAEKEKLGLKPYPHLPGHYDNYDQFLADQIYERIMDKANDDDWSDADDGDYYDRD